MKALQLLYSNKAFCNKKKKLKRQKGILQINGIELNQFNLLEFKFFEIFKCIIQTQA